MHGRRACRTISGNPNGRTTGGSIQPFDDCGNHRERCHNLCRASACSLRRASTAKEFARCSFHWPEARRVAWIGGLSPAPRMRCSAVGGESSPRSMQTIASRCGWICPAAACAADRAVGCTVGYCRCSLPTVGHAAGGGWIASGRNPRLLRFRGRCCTTVAPRRRHWGWTPGYARR